MERFVGSDVTGGRGERRDERGPDAVAVGIAPLWRFDRRDVM